ncbi:MAG: hypothetical protein KDA85_11345 [Planctomycetaceae bacterium]|nr:hypothetical protein [Planctomycetaceae bacterium]
MILKLFRAPVVGLICLLVMSAGHQPARAGRPVAAQLLPSNSLAYVEAPDPAAAISVIFDHPLRAEIESLDVYRQATTSQPYRNFLTGRKTFEILMGMEWRPAIEALTAQGIHLAAVPESRGFILLVHGRDEAVMETFRTKILEMSRMNQAESKREREYRGVQLYEINKVGVAVVDEWLVATNASEAGRFVLDGLLDGVQTKNLSTNEVFQQAIATRPETCTAWGFLNLDAVREQPKVQRALNGQAENPLVELIAGGIQSTLQKSAFVSGNIQLAPTSLAMTIGSPWNADWIPEERDYYFGPDHQGTAAPLPQVEQTVLTLSTWRNVSEMWLRAGDLFDANMNDRLAEADATLTTLFSGRDFGEDILGSFDPEVGLIVARQKFDWNAPIPAIRLPAFALVLNQKDPDQTTRELRRIFQSLIGFVNITGANEGRPQLDLDMEKQGDGEIITSTFQPDSGGREADNTAILFNFSPSIGFRGSRTVISSTSGLAREILAAPEPVANRAATDDDVQRVNTRLMFHADVLQNILSDNQEQLIAQNMLSDGHTREEAETTINLLLQAIGYVKGANLTLSHDNQSLQLQLRIQTAEGDIDGINGN